MEEQQKPHKRRVRYSGKYPKKFEEKYNVVKNFLQEMPKQQAIAELEDEKYKSELGEYFDTLYAETFSREK